MTATAAVVSSTRFGPESTRSDSGSVKNGQTAHESDLISGSGYEKVRSNPSQLRSTAGQTSVSGVTDSSQRFGSTIFYWSAAVRVRFDGPDLRSIRVGQSTVKPGQQLNTGSKSVNAVRRSGMRIR
ncbi:hypothetical protein Hanom_Chr12g01167961 [Helianthus anomalus]